MASHSNVYCLSVLVFKGIPSNMDHYKMLLWGNSSLSMYYFVLKQWITNQNL